MVIVQSKNSSTILLIGSDRTLGYLLKRYAERSGYRLVAREKVPSVSEIMPIDPVVIVFLSTEILETTQVLVRQLASLDALIMLCSSVSDEAKARELGADYCLVHPLTYDAFQSVLTRGGVRNPV